MESGELRRIDHGPADSESTEGAFVVHITARADDSSAVLSRVREVLRIVAAGPGLTADQDRASRMPAWFSAACAPEMTVAQADGQLARWRANPADHEEDPWTLANWLYWFEPDMRSWWWDGGVVGPDALSIEILVQGYPYANGALRWLLRAAGARDIVFDD